MFSTVNNRISKKIRLCFFYCFLLIFSLFTFENSFAENNVISIGNKDAKVTVKVFSSLTCPHCANFHEKIFYKTNKEFIESNVVKFEHHPFPLDMASLNAEKVLRCSTNSSSKMEFLGEIYEKQNFWASSSDINSINAKLLKIAKNYNLNNDKVNNCLNDEKLEEQILNSLIEGDKKYKITSTPTIIINDKKYDGKHNYEDFRKEIKKFLE